MSERLVQYEFKVIIRVDAEAWPNEVRAGLLETISCWAPSSVREIVSVERISDY